jgi:hypothetical protein
MRPTAATRPSPSFFLTKHKQQQPIPTSSRAAGAVAADPCKHAENKKKRAGRSWRAASAGSSNGGGDEYGTGKSVSTVAGTSGRRRARLSARRRESIRQGRI